MGPETQNEIMATVNERDRLRAVIEEFLAAEEAVEKEADRAEKSGGGWSSAPVVRRIYAIKAMRAAIGVDEPRGPTK